MTEVTTHPEAERWNRRYRERSEAYGAEPSPFLRDCLRDLRAGGRRPARALDVAMGEGRNALFLAATGYSVVGVDVSLVAAGRAARASRRSANRLHCLVGDLDRWCFDDRQSARFDLILQFYFLDLDLFPTLVESLAAGGHLILETFSKRHAEVSTFGPRNPSFLLDPDAARDALSALDLLVFDDAIVELDEGRHQGPAGLLRVLARKPPPAPSSGARP